MSNFYFSQSKFIQNKQLTKKKGKSKINLFKLNLLLIETFYRCVFPNNIYTDTTKSRVIVGATLYCKLNMLKVQYHINWRHSIITATVQPPWAALHFMGLHIG